MTLLFLWCFILALSKEAGVMAGLALKLIPVCISESHLLSWGFLELMFNYTYPVCFITCFSTNFLSTQSLLTIIQRWLVLFFFFLHLIPWVVNSEGSTSHSHHMIIMLTCLHDWAVDTLLILHAFLPLLLSLLSLLWENFCVRHWIFSHMCLC